MKKILSLVLMVVALFALTACGGDEATTAPAGGDTGSTGGGSALTVDSAEGANLAYAQSSLEATAGEVKVTFDNKGAIPHNWTLVAQGQEEAADTAALSAGAPDYLAPDAIAQTKMLNAGATETVTFNVQPGTYTYLCTFPGHYQAGMKGTLVVK